jgi:hypothetical protein
MKFFVGLFLTICVITLGIFLVTPSTQGQKKDDDKSLVENPSQFPIADFASASSDANSNERKAKDIYFDRARYGKIVEDVRIKYITYAESWIESLPAIPVKRSNIILTGSVAGSRAFLSKNKTNVYSEFNVKVDSLVRTDNGIAITPEQIIAVNRMGGGVRFASGHIQNYWLSGAGALEMGEKYIVFLKRDDSMGGFLLLTAFKIENEKIFPIDDTLGVAAYKGVMYTEFLKEIEKAITTSQNKEETGT